MAASIDSTITNDWRDFTVEYEKNGLRFREKAYLTISLDLGNKNSKPTRQIVVLPDCHVILAEWAGKGPTDYRRLRDVAMHNVTKMRVAKLTDADLEVY
jgi:hypothetical protein